MIIKSKLTEKDFINVNFVLLYSRPIFKIITIIFCVLVLIGIPIVIVLPKTSLTQILFPLIFLSLMPLMTYFTAKRNFKANKRISETIEYQFDKDYLSAKGESFNTQQTWDKIYKVTQTKNWILIWQNNQVANPIHKRDIWDGEINDLKNILQAHNVKNNL